jgi:hypothetical protein
MRLFNFLSKFAFICNIAFLLFVFFRWMELRKTVDAGTSDQLVSVPILKDLIITLGICAIAINLLINIFYLFFILRGKFKSMPRWLPSINFILLIVQILYFFLY